MEAYEYHLIQAMDEELPVKDGQSSERKHCASPEQR